MISKNFLVRAILALTSPCLNSFVKMEKYALYKSGKSWLFLLPKKSYCISPSSENEKSIQAGSQGERWHITKTLLI